MTRGFILWLAFCMLASALPAGAADTNGKKQFISKKFRLTISEPAVVSLADPGERRWGRHQFVSLSPYPGGKLLLRFHAGEDAVSAYGSGQPTYLSSDQGATWQPFHAAGLPASGLICTLQGGDSFCMPMPKPLKASDPLPEAAGELFTYRKILLYPASKCSPRVQEYLAKQPAWRWTKDREQWTAEMVSLDAPNRLVWIGPGGESGLISGITFERTPIPVGNELLWAEYRGTYLKQDGSVPKGFGVSCVVSSDNGRSWRRRASIVEADAIPGEVSSMTEPVLCQNAKGDILCVIRRTDQKQRSMLITSSADHGKTWIRPRPLVELGNFGVMPDLIRLASGPLVLAYGRPGVNLAFSLNGTGDTWEEPFCLLEGDPKNTSARTDGYSSLMPLNTNEFLVAYSDFDRLDDQARKRKAILVSRIKFETVQ